MGNVSSVLSKHYAMMYGLELNLDIFLTSALVTTSDAQCVSLGDTAPDTNLNEMGLFHSQS
jgi:hypothetical protein